MKNININTITPQTATCEELDRIAHDYYGLQQTLDDEDYGCHSSVTLKLPESITSTNGVFTDTKEVLENNDCNITGTECQRIKDPNVLSVLLSNITHSLDGKLTKSEVEAVTTIDSAWFQNNTDIVNFEEFEKFTGITYLGKSGNLFSGCTNLKVIRLPENLTAMHRANFTNCSSLEKLYIPASFISFDQSNFNGCTSKLKVIYIDADHAACISYGDYGTRTPMSAGGKMYFIDDEENPVTDIVLTSAITCVKDLAFYNATQLLSVTLPSTVLKIYKSAFYNCKGLTKVTFANLQHLLNCTFSDYTSNPLYYAHHLYFDDDPNTEITEINIPDGITAINANVFANGTSLTKITIPSSVTSIGAGAFYNCTSLSNLESLDLSNITTIGDNDTAVFGGNVLIKKIYLPNATYVGQIINKNLNVELVILPACTKTDVMACAVWDNSPKLRTVILPSVETISYGLLYFTRFYNLIIGNKLTYIGKQIWRNQWCDFNVICHTIVPATADDIDNWGKCTNLFVPEESIEAYSSAAEWSTCYNNIYAIGSTEWATAMQTMGETEGYELKDGESWSDEYIDFKIYGCEPPNA